MSRAGGCWSGPVGSHNRGHRDGMKKSTLLRGSSCHGNCQCSAAMCFLWQTFQAREKAVLRVHEILTLSTAAGGVSQDWACCSLDAFTTSCFLLILFFQSSSPLFFSSATLTQKETQSHSEFGSTLMSCKRSTAESL